MIDAESGKLNRQLPGFRDKSGKWRTSKERIAIAGQTQLAEVENAEAVAFAELMIRSKLTCETSWSTNVLQDMPGLFELEDALRALNANKAPGLDGLGAVFFFQMNIPQTAQRIFPLLLKMFARQQGIVEFTRGWLVPLHKGTGSTAQMSGYRAILLEPTSKSSVQSMATVDCQRSSLCSPTTSIWWEDRSGSWIPAPSNSTMANQCGKKTSVPLNGFRRYAVTKQMIAGFDGSHAALVHIFHRMGMPHSALDGHAPTCLGRVHLQYCKWWCHAQTYKFSSTYTCWGNRS